MMHLCIMQYTYWTPLPLSQWSILQISPFPKIYISPYFHKIYKFHPLFAFNLRLFLNLRVWLPLFLLHRKLDVGLLDASANADWLPELWSFWRVHRRRLGAEFGGRKKFSWTKITQFVLSYASSNTTSPYIGGTNAGPPPPHILGEPST